jgi:hypothetical protein
MVFADLVDGVFRNFDDEVGVCNKRLTGQARRRFQTPRAVEQILFLFFRIFQGIEAFADHDVASGAGTRFFAGVLDLDIVFEQDVAYRLAAWRFYNGSVRTQGGVREYDDLWHWFYLVKQ